MALLVIGLALFLGVHSIRIFAEDWRTAARARLGEGPWKGLYSLVSIAGFVLIVWGYGASRAQPMDLWYPPTWTRHLAALLTVPSFVLLAAAYVPGTRIKAAVKHPMVASVKIWALAHLLANGRLADVVLFGAFLVWAVLDFRCARQRDRRDGVRYETGPITRDLLAVVVGAAAWALFAFGLHVRLIGVAPFL
jgi:uncharacterized membrane protein